MIVIRLQRTGRSGHAAFRVVVQDSRRSPLSGNVIAYLGNYDPHTKKVSLDKDQLEEFLNNGAQPSNRIIGILKAEKIKLPSWVEAKPAKKKTVRNPEKRRSTAPEGKVEPKPEVADSPEDGEQESASPDQEVAEEESTNQTEESNEQAKVEETSAQPEAAQESEVTEEKADETTANSEAKAE